MIDAADFLEPARALGFRWYAGVPCSFLTPFINYVINDAALDYLSAANEGDAVAAAAGAWIGGWRAVVLMQNSGLGNAVNPLTSLAHPFRIPLLVIVTLRGDPRLGDEPQHELMGRMTGHLLEAMGVPWEYFPAEASGVGPVLARAERYMAKEHRPYALVMRKGTVAAYEQPPMPLALSPAGGEAPVQGEIGGSPELRPTRAEALGRIVELTPVETTVVIGTTGYTGRELAALADRPNQLYVVGSMGCASSLALGLSLARPDLKVTVVDGDGAALMRMGNFATLGAYGSSALAHLLLDNEVHESTGGQATVSSRVRFAEVARACGYGFSAQGEAPEVIDRVLGADAAAGPRFGHLKIRPGTLSQLPRPTLGPVEVRERLMRHIGSWGGDPHGARRPAR
jgi:phosphonopyruvate decarboxylase